MGNVMGFWCWILGNTIQGECVPRAFFNATAWAISSKRPVYIADFLGHWQAVGEHEGGLHFLQGDGWNVRPGKKEGDKPMVKLWNLRDAMEHFITHNPWAMPTEEEERINNRRILTFDAEGMD
jgi:hypothetical protein